MAVDTVLDLVSEICASGLFDSARLEELRGTVQASFSDPRSLGRELVQRGWLTPFQAGQLLRGKGRDLFLGPYVLLERLGEGAMGRVYKARHILMDRIVALKVLNLPAGADSEVVARFQREIQASARLQHPNIVLAHDAAQIGEKHFLVMEFVDGTDLAGLVQKVGRLPVVQACEYIRQAAFGLQHAHERGLVHRDIKPSNLFLATRELVIKILDLGIARPGKQQIENAEAAAGADSAASRHESTDDLTQSGRLMGTPDYIAPEQAADARRADIRSDIYSLGCTFYFLLTGQPPFAGGSQTEKLRRHHHEEPVPAESLRADLPEEVGRVLRKMMAKRPEDRFRTPMDVAEAIYKAVPTPGQDAGFLLPVDEGEWTELDFDEPTVVESQPRPVSVPEAGTSPAERSSEKTGGRRRPRPMLLAVGIVCLASLTLLLLLRPRTDIPSTSGHILRHWGIVQGVAFSPDGSVLATGSTENIVRLWNTAQLFPFGVLEGHAGAVNAVAFLPDGLRLLTGSSDHTLRLWDLATQQELRRFEGHTWLVQSIAVSRDGRRAVSAGADKTARLWDIYSGEELRVLESHGGPVLGVALSADDRYIASACQDWTVRIWDSHDGRESARLAGHRGAVWSVAFLPDGHRLVSSGEDGTIRLWDWDKRQELHRFVGHQGPVVCIAVSADGQRILSGSADGTVRLWDIEEGRELERFIGHTDQVRCVAFSPDGRRAVSGGADQSVRIWSLSP